MPCANPHSLGKFYQPFLIARWRSLTALLLCISAWPLYITGIPYCIKILVDTLSHKDSPSNTSIAYPLIAMFLIKVFFEISFRVYDWIWLHFITSLREQMRKTVFHSIQKHSYRFFSDHLAGGISRYVQDIPEKAERILEFCFFLVFPLAVGLITAFSLLWKIHIVFALLFMGYFCLHLTACIFWGESERKAAQEHAEANSNLSGALVDSILNMSTVRLFANFSFENVFLEKYHKKESSTLQKTLWETTKLRSFLGGSEIALCGMFFSLLFYLWTENRLSMGDFTLALQILSAFMGWIWWMGSQITRIMQEVSASKKALTTIYSPYEITDDPKAQPLCITRGDIQFNNVFFSYNASAPVFFQFNLHIHAQEKVGLVGFSGAGKTTLVHLLLRHFDIQQGAICIDNQDIKKVTQESLRRHIALVPQDPLLFHRSIFENIQYGKPQATQAEVIQAAQQAQCHEFIMSLEKGYDTIVGERGIKLSGGQRQRISIARALLKNAPILVLDEATSSLDTQTEKEIQFSLIPLMKERTVLVIAHRLSTLSQMNRLIVFKNGQIIEQGSQSELLHKKGSFFRLWNMQVNGFLPQENNLRFPSLDPYEL